MRKWLSISVLLLLAVLTGCADRDRVSARLDALDSLVSLPPTSPEPRVDYDSILVQLDTLLYDAIGDDGLEARWNLLYAMTEDKADRPLLSDLHVRPAYDYYREATKDGTHGDSTLLHRFAQSCFYLGVHYYHSDSTALLEQMMKKSVDVAKSCNDHYTAYLAMTYLSKKLYWSNYNIACSMALNAQDEYRLSGHRDPYNELCLLINIGYCYLNGAQWKDALPYLEKARLCSVKMDSLFYGDVVYGLSAYYYKANDSAKSIELLDDGVSHITKNYENCLYIAEILIANDSLERANDFLCLALEKGAKEKAIIFSRLQKIAVLQHDEKKAVIYGDSVLHAFQVKYYDAIHQNYDINVRQLEQERKIMLAEHRLFMQKTVFTIIVVVFVFLLILFWVILRQKKKRRDQLVSFERTRRKILEERSRLEMHQQELINRKNQEKISLLKSQLERQSSIMEHFKAVDDTGSRMMHMTNDDWQNLELALDDTYQQFVTRLRQQFPKMNEEGIRLCMLGKLGLTTRQISNIFSISPLSVTKRKQRLRKDYLSVIEEGKTFDEIIENM